MIWQPRPGQMVEIRYNKKFREQFEHSLHGHAGFVEKVATGPKLKNVLVVILSPYDRDFEWLVVVPRGNLFVKE